MVVPPGTPPNQSGSWLPEPRPAAPALTGYTVPGGWGKPPKLRAPGTVTAAAVLTYILGGVGILASFFLIVAAPVVLEPALSTTVGAAGLLVSGLYVAAGLLLQLRASRAFLLWLVIISLGVEGVGLVLDVTRLVNGRSIDGGGGLCSLILPVIVLALLRHRNTVEWVEARRGGPGQPML